MVAMNDILQFSDRVADEFDPERIILFGSHASGLARLDSDVDILVVMQFAGKGLHKSLEILKKTNPHFSVDLITRQPEDVVRRYRDGDPLIRSALDQGKVLYERRRN